MGLPKCPFRLFLFDFSLYWSKAPGLTYAEFSDLTFRPLDTDCTCMSYLQPNDLWPQSPACWTLTLAGLRLHSLISAQNSVSILLSGTSSVHSRTLFFSFSTFHYTKFFLGSDSLISPLNCKLLDEKTIASPFRGHPYHQTQCYVTGAHKTAGGLINILSHTM